MRLVLICSRRMAKQQVDRTYCFGLILAADTLCDAQNTVRAELR